ncbi:hypothetical protein [Paenibacillus sp. LjRoot56]|uniref:hypothetical protein n=1 Tax=Paenibacillus sp. LjRoot56 TaxID=3342333 RepID=UPI003ECC6AED
MKKLLVFISATLVTIMLAGCEQSANESIISPSPTTTIAPTESPNPTATTVSGTDVRIDDKASFILKIRDLEEKTLSVMGVAEKKAIKENAPTFEELIPELLKYNTENAIKRWEDMYNNDPGWIMEPRGLIYAHKHSMYEPSFRLNQVTNGKIIIFFKTYGNPTYSRAEQVKYTLVKTNIDDWRIDSLEATPLDNTFSLVEVKEIMAYEIESAEYVKEDDIYYYFKATNQKQSNQDYVFHKKDGYLDLAP